MRGLPTAPAEDAESGAIPIASIPMPREFSHPCRYYGPIPKGLHAKNGTPEYQEWTSRIYDEAIGDKPYYDKLNIAIARVKGNAPTPSKRQPA